MLEEKPIRKYLVKFHNSWASISEEIKFWTCYRHLPSNPPLPRPLPLPLAFLSRGGATFTRRFLSPNCALSNSKASSNDSLSSNSTYAKPKRAMDCYCTIMQVISRYLRYCWNYKRKMFLSQIPVYILWNNLWNYICGNCGIFGKSSFKLNLPKKFLLSPLGGYLRKYDYNLIYQV